MKAEVLLLGAVLFCAGCRKADEPEKVAVRVEQTGVVPAELAGEFSGDKAMEVLRELTALGPRPPGSEGYAKALVLVKKRLAESGWETKEQSFTAATPIGPVGFTNLLARYAPEGGTDWRGSVSYVLGSHLDTKLFTGFEFTGVNDSGSSSVVLLELARVLAKNPEAARQVELVFFDGEEAKLKGITPRDGLYGSKYYAGELWDRTKQPRAALVLDLVGDPDSSFILSPESPEWLHRVAARVIEGEGLAGRFEKAPGQIVDDHEPLQSIGGLDSLLLIGNFQKMKYWHTEDDTLENVSAESLEEAGRFALRFLSEVGK